MIVILILVIAIYSILLIKLLRDAPGTELQVKYDPLLPENHREISYKYNKDCGLDLKCWIPEGSLILSPHASIDIHTGMYIKLPRNTWGRIIARSSTGVKGLSVLTGIIDEGYTGELMAFVYNHTDREILIDDSDRLVQLIIIPRPNISKIKKVLELPSTKRGSCGFGSTGV